MSVKIELVNYFKEGVSMGNSTNSLKKSLIEGGHNEADIYDSFLSFSATQKTLPTFPNQVKNSEERERPIGVSILAVLNFIAVGLIILGMILAIRSDVSQLILLLIPAILSFLIGRGLWRGINAWRIFLIVMSSISIFLNTMVIILLSLMLSLIDNITTISLEAFSIIIVIFGLVIVSINIFLIWYLGFKKNVVEFFKN